MAKYRIATGPVPLADDPAGNDETIILIDTLRASSTIVTALSLGIETIVPVLNDQEAFHLKNATTVLSGEAGGIKIKGYDIGNSPVELIKTYRESPFSTLVLKTSNFTPLVLSLPRAVVCSTLNLGAIARHLNGKNALLIAAGGKRGIAEDFGTALALCGLLSGVDLDALAVKTFVKESITARHLCAIGYEQDVEFVARVNVFDIVPVFDGRRIKKADL